MSETVKFSPKYVTFLCDNKQFDYKFDPNESWTTTERIIRIKFGLSAGAVFSLCDLFDNTVFSEEYLSHLADKSRVLIDIAEKSELSAAVVSSNKTYAIRRIDGNAGVLGIKSFSDNNQELSLASVSNTTTSSASDSDAKYSLRYKSAVPLSGVTKQENAQEEKDRFVTKSQCNRKILHFLEKYANLKPYESMQMNKEIQNQLDLRSYQLFNLLKYTRKNIDIPSLLLSKENLIDVLREIHQDYYIPSRR